MAINDYKINDLNSFDTATKDEHSVAGLYFYSVLDHLIDLAYKVSCDFYLRPHLFTDVKDAAGRPLAATIAKMHYQYGNNENALSKSQRQWIYDPLFGVSSNNWIEEEGDFPRLRDDLIAASSAYAERVFDSGLDILRESVRASHRPFHEYLEGLSGDSVTWSRDSALPAITDQISYLILRSPGVSAVFGIAKPPKDEWPYTEDSNGDKLVEGISKQLKEIDISGVAYEVDGMQMCITRELFSNLQRVALRGAEAIATIVEFDAASDNNDLEVLVRKCYTWGSALNSIRDNSRTGESRKAEMKMQPRNRSLLLTVTR